MDPMGDDLPIKIVISMARLSNEKVNLLLHYVPHEITTDTHPREDVSRCCMVLAPCHARAKLPRRRQKIDIVTWEAKKKTGWWFEPLWKILVNCDDYSQYMGK